MQNENTKKNQFTIINEYSDENNLYDEFSSDLCDFEKAESSDIFINLDTDDTSTIQ